ncbi:hypothetical protein Nepgr_023176 [Nepenthes gracilis]|uniref:Uncharacterized protein n=1 Tax=Nepenthes gracilis TaxID=150966 RepID=A0AAD3T2E3_NEPGR|nr:hypothetical protein Nepgr_023176 [Nepenthes gracilis]
MAEEVTEEAVRMAEEVTEEAVRMAEEIMHRGAWNRVLDPLWCFVKNGMMVHDAGSGILLLIWLAVLPGVCAELLGLAGFKPSQLSVMLGYADAAGNFCWCWGWALLQFPNALSLLEFMLDGLLSMLQMV